MTHAWKSLLLGSILFLSSAFSAKAQAEEWEKLFQQDISTFYLDKQSIKAEGEQVSFWLQVLLENPDELSLKPLEEVRMQQVIDCDKQAISEPVAWENRNAEGKVVETGQRPKDMINWVPFAELEGAEELSNRLCKQ